MVPGLTVNEFIGRKKRRNPSSSPEFIAYARYLGIDPVADTDLMWIAEEALWAPLPEEWTEHFDSGDRVFYYSTQTRCSSWTHPLEQLHRDVYKDIVRFRTQVQGREEQDRELVTWRQRCERAERESQRDLQAWTEHSDEQGRDFYYNREENRSTWTDPRRARIHMMHLQLQAFRIISKHCGVPEAAGGFRNIGGSSTPRGGGWAEIESVDLDFDLRDEQVPDERTEQLIPYYSRRPKALTDGAAALAAAVARRQGAVSAEALGSVGECVVCFDASATHIVVPCGHQALCRRCAQRYLPPSERQSCPCCRGRIERIIEVFVPKPRPLHAEGEPSPRAPAGSPTISIRHRL